MLQVKEPFTWVRGCSCIPSPDSDVQIPAGAPVIWNERNQQHYVMSVFFQNDLIVRHDAIYHGCRVAKENVI